VTATSPVLARAVLAAADHTAHRPTGAAFDVVLILHVVCAVVGLGTVVVSAVQAGRFRTVASGQLPSGVRSYFAPGVNWAGRALYGVPVFGFVLVGMSDGFFDVGDGWILWGLVLWVAAIWAAEALLWPAERRVKAVLADRPDGPWPEAARDCRTVVWLGSGLTAVLILAVVLMVVQP